MINKSLKILWWFFFLIGLFCVCVRFIGGKEIAAYNGYIPWGLWVAVYTYFVGLSAGAFLLSTMVYVFNIKAMEKIGKLALYTSLCTLIGALITIFMDLGSPFRAWKVILNPNFKSMMAWMIWLYSAYLVLLLFEIKYAARKDLIMASRKPGIFGIISKFFVGKSTVLTDESIAHDKKILKILGTIGVPLAIAFHGGVGALFGVVGARPFWNASIYPLMFLGGALVSGTALLTFFVSAFWKDKESIEFKEMLKFLANATLALLVFDIILEWAEFSISWYAGIPAHSIPWKLIMFGPYWWVFWFVHIFLGIVVPLYILSPAKRRYNPKMVAISAFLIAFTFLAVRINIVIPGLALEELEGLENAYSDFRLHFQYFPNFWEWGITFFSYTITLLLLYVGAKNLSLTGQSITKGE